MGNIINLEKNILENAKIAACRINDKESRIRAYALNIAANATAQYLDKMGLESDTSLSLYKISMFQEQFEIADVYVKGFRFDVRVSFDGKTFTVPKIHAKYGVSPLAYIVIKLDESLTNAEFLGFLPTEDLTYPESSLEYYTFESSALKPIDEIKELIENSTLNIHPYSANNHDKIKELSISFIDGEISDSEKVFFIKHVLACPVCRESFCDVSDFDTIVAQIKNYQELLNDSTLSVLSGNKEEFDEAVIANLGLEENIKENVVTETDVNQAESMPTEEVAFLDEDVKEDVEEKIVEELADVTELESDDATTLEKSVDDELLVVEDSVDIDTPVTDNFTGENVEIEEVVEETIKEETSEEEITEELDLLAYVDDSEPVEITENQEPQELVNAEQSLELSVGADTDNSDLLLDDTHTIEELGEIESLHHDDTLDLEHLELHDDIDLLQEHSENNILHEESNLEEKSVEKNILQDNAFELVEDEDIKEEFLNEDREENPLFQDIVENKSTDVDEDIDTLADGIELIEEDSMQQPVVEDAVTKSEEPRSFYTPFEPVELKYDDDTEDDNLLSEESLSDTTDEQPEQKEADVEQASNTVDEDIQSLLDDDLMALLTEDAPQEDSVEQVENVQEEQVSSDSVAPSDINQVASDENIETLFENDKETISGFDSDSFELAQEPISQDIVKKTKNYAIFAGLLIVLLGVGSTALVFNKQKSMKMDESVSGNEMFDFSTKAEDSSNNLPAVSQDINRSIANSFSDKPAAITITKLAWQISEKLAVEPSVKEYLQTAGKNIQMNLQNDIANSPDVLMNNTVKVSLLIAPDNTLKSVQLLESSGSDGIDETIKTSIKNTLKYISVPKLNDYKSDYFLTLIINF